MRKNIFVLLLLVAVMPLFCATVFGQEKTQAKKIRVLLVTGEDHPAHRWQETAPMLRNDLNTDREIECRLVDDPEVLGTDIVFDYDVLVFHFKNYKPLKRNEQAKKNLTQFIDNGGGLVLVHFACGAFQEWSEFGQIAGRVYDPKKPAHDPYGRFKVEYSDREHNVTQNLADFEITDELYTCLKDATVPVHVLAESTSKIDKKRHSMAFVREHGKGRIFLTTLGHDIKSISSPDFKTLLQRAVRWTGKR
ncbi:MAG: ThuA domain-containing protein [Planctomycetaceae bacterium]|nr:ThuA domain-containing protein [Planctomycetaceae bacterium]